MDRKKHLLRHLYGEDDDPRRLGGLLEDDALRQEYQALSEIKHHLDHRLRPRPSATVLDAIFAEASRERPVPGRRADRAPVPGSRVLRFRALGVVSSMLVLLLAGVVGLNVLNRSHAPEASQVASVEEVPLPAEARPVPEIAMAPQTAAAEAAVQEIRDAETEPVSVHPPEALVAQAAPPTEIRSADPPAAAPAPPVAKRKPTPVALDWDESDEVLDVHRQFRLVEARSGGASWGDFESSSDESASGREAADTEAIQVDEEDLR